MPKKRPSRFEQYVSWLPKTPAAMAAEFRATKDPKARATLTGTVVKGAYWVLEARGVSPADKRKTKALAEALLLAITKDARAVLDTRWDRWALPEDLNTAWTWFKFNPSVKFAAQLERMLPKADAGLTALIVEQLGAMGFDRSLASLVRAAKRADLHIATNLAAGIQESRGRGELSARFRGTMFEALTRLAAGERNLKGDAEAVETAYDAVLTALWSLDHERAFALFTSTRCMRADHPNIRSILVAIEMIRGGKLEFKLPAQKGTKAGGRNRFKYHPPAPEVLWPFFEDMLTKTRKRRDHWPWKHTLLTTLSLAAEHEPTLVRQKLAALLKVISPAYTETDVKEIKALAVKAEKRLGIKHSA